MISTASVSHDPKSVSPARASVGAAIDWRSPPDRFLDVGHSDLAYRKIGTGPDVVFVHGWPVSSATWRGLVSELAERFTCHLVDLPGAGFTRCRDSEVIEIGRHVETMHRVVELLGLERYALVAHDSGAVVARELAARDADRVAGLVMGNTEIPGHFPWLLGLYLGVAMVPGGGALFAGLLGSRLFRHSGLAFGACFDDPSFADGDFHDLCVRPIVEDPRRRAETLKLLETFDTSALKSLRETHGRIKAPVKLIWGAGDPFFPLAEARAMVDQFTASPMPVALTVLDPGKLFVHEERPADFAEAAGPFLARCFEGGGTNP